MAESAMISTGREPSPTTMFKTTRRFLLQINEFGIAITRTMDAAGVGEWSSNVDLGALGVVAISGQVRPRDLLAPTRLTRGGLSNLLDRLESAQLITRTYGEVTGDRRGALVTITARGQALVAEVADAASRAMVEQRSVIIDLIGLLDELGAGRGPTRRTPAPSRVEVLEMIGDIGTLFVNALASVDPNDPTPTKTAIVLSLCHQPGNARPRDLIEPTQLSSGGVSQLLDRLERAALIRRTAGDRSDRRSVVIAPTIRGSRLHRLHLAAVGSNLSEARPLLDGFAAHAATT